MRRSSWPSCCWRIFSIAIRAGSFSRPTISSHKRRWPARSSGKTDSTPSGNALAAAALVRLGKLTGRVEYLEAAHRTLQAAAGLMERYPAAAAEMLCALGLELGPTPELVILGDPDSADARDVVADLRRRFIPDKVVALRPGSQAIAGSALDPLFAGKTALDPPPTVFLCERFACQAPVTGCEAALGLWRKLAP